MAEPVAPVDGVYYIDKPEQLAYIAKIVNEGNTLEGKTVLLRNDLDLSGKSWTPIGRYQIPFSGELNGNGRSVTGLAISYNSLGYLEGYAGLVGFAGKTAYLHFLNINGSILSSRDSCGFLLGGSWSGSQIERCTVSGSVTARSNIGGIAACTEDSASIMNCYFTGSIISDESKKSGLVAGQGSYGSTPTISNCYWSKECNMTIDGLPDVKRGVGTDVSEDPTTGLTLTEMRTKANYAGWDYDTIWAIDTNINGGLPYLLWQDDVPTVIEPTSLTLSAETVTLAAGRSTTLTAVFSPIGAGGKPTWSSDAPDVASVTAGGQVAAHRAGTAIITASYGSLQASCSVTVTERSSDEYTIREITLKDASGKAVTGIPSDSFWAYVSVTKGANAKDATVLLASYDRNGQYLGLTALEADVPCGTTYRLGAWFANADRRVAKVKAFVVDGVGTMRPLAAAAEIS